MEDRAIIQTRNLSKDYDIRQPLLSRLVGKERRSFSAVSDISIDIYTGEALSVVGESGCGKSTLARLLMLLYNDYRGDILFEGGTVRGKGKKWITGEYRKHVQMVFQDPYSCLNPRKTVKSALREVLDVHEMYSAAERDTVITDLLAKCGISADLMNKYPGELSGGQSQRIGIARALLLSPEVLIADEPVSALDVSVQAQVINLLKDLQEDLKLTLIFISHDLSVVRYISDRVAVMYLGRIVEIGRTEDIFGSALHPYTRLLLASAPVISLDEENEEETQDIEEAGSTEDTGIPGAADHVSGCRFRTRCPHAAALCAERVPELRDFGGGHFAACHFAGEI